MLPAPNGLALPPFRSTPISDFNRTEPLLSLAFPTLFPYGGAEFTIPRQRSVSYKDYIRHLMKHESARFAQNPCFRFVAFNTIMRHQAAKSAGFYVRRQADRPHITVDELQELFMNDEPESRSLLSSASRLANVLPGTRPYWARRD